MATLVLSLGIGLTILGVIGVAGAIGMLLAPEGCIGLLLSFGVAALGLYLTVSAGFGYLGSARHDDDP